MTPFIRLLLFYSSENEFWKYCPQLTLRDKCLYLEFFWSVFSSIWTEYGEILRISMYSVRMRENTDWKNSEYGHFSRSVTYYVL